MVSDDCSLQKVWNWNFFLTLIIPSALLSPLRSYTSSQKFIYHFQWFIGLLEPKPTQLTSSLVLQCFCINSPKKVLRIPEKHEFFGLKIYRNFVLLLFYWVIMYRSNRSFNMPPPGNQPGIWLFWKLLFKFPPTRDKMPFKCPTLGSIQVIKGPHPRDISQAQKWQKDGGNTFSCQTKYL